MFLINNYILDNYEDAASREVEIYLTSGGETDVGDMGEENRRKILKTCHKPNDDSMYKFIFVPALYGMNILCLEDEIQLIMHL